MGTANEERVAALAGAVLTREAGQALALLGQAVDQGLQLGELLDQLIEYWRDLMVVNCAGIENQDLSVTGKQLTALKEQADRLNADTILAGLDVLVSAKNRMRFTSHGRVVMEMALVRLCRLDDLVSLSQLAQWVSGEGAVGAVSKKTALAQISGEQKRESSSLTPLEKKKVAADEPAAAVRIADERFVGCRLGASPCPSWLYSRKRAKEGSGCSNCRAKRPGVTHPRGL